LSRKGCNKKSRRLHRPVEHVYFGELQSEEPQSRQKKLPKLIGGAPQRPLSDIDTTRICVKRE
jgi:hypothetical protein